METFFVLNLSCFLNQLFHFEIFIGRSELLCYLICVGFKTQLNCLPAAVREIRIVLWCYCHASSGPKLLARNLFPLSFLESFRWQIGTGTPGMLGSLTVVSLLLMQFSEERNNDSLAGGRLMLAKVLSLGLQTNESQRDM